MSLQEMFSRLRGSAAFMPYVCAGDPSAGFTLRLVETLASSGADAIELGIPFSDPIADGRTIQLASSRALAHGMRPSMVREIISQIRAKGIRVPLIVMTYYNILYANGMEGFLGSLKKAGADALIVPDAPLEESGPLAQLCGSLGLDLIYLVAPNGSEARLREIAGRSSGFLYAVSVFGITGAREQVSREALAFVERVKRIARTPVAMGFGVSRPEQASALAAAGADGVIVGSALVEVYARHIREAGFDEARALDDVAQYARAMKAALGAGRRGEERAGT